MRKNSCCTKKQLFVPHPPCNSGGGRCLDCFRQKKRGFSFVKVEKGMPLFSAEAGAVVLRIKMERTTTELGARFVQSTETETSKTSDLVRPKLKTILTSEMRAKIKGLPSPRKIALDWMACQECFFIYSWKIFHFLSPSSSSSFGGLFFPSENRGNMRPSVSPLHVSCGSVFSLFCSTCYAQEGRGGERRVPPSSSLAMRRGGGAEEMDRILDTLRLHL